MTTWVLFVIVLYGNAGEPRAITNVPGFRSDDECTTAAGEMMKHAHFLEGGIRVVAWCAPGPKK
jgi:hypothetical protein